MTDTQLPASLIEHLARGDVIPLIGAGVSMSICDKNGNRAFPSWSELLRNAADKLKAEHLDKQSQLVSLQVDMEMYQDAAKVAQEHLSGRRWYDFIQSQFSFDFSQLDEPCKTLPRAIWQLSNRVVTLNYDKVLEWAHVESANVCAFDNANRSQLAEFVRAGSKDMLWHLHGRIDTPEHMVLTPQSYHRLYQENAEEHYEAALVKLKELITSKVLLFIGCSLDDAELLAEIVKQNSLFEGNTGPHYALVRQIDKQKIAQKLQGTDVQLLTFSEFGQPLINYVQQLVNYKNQQSKHQLTKHAEASTQQSKEQATQYDKITVLTASPLDKPLDATPIISKIKNYKYPIYPQALTESNLREADDYSILFLIAKKTSNGLLIEDNNACSDYLPIEELGENLSTKSKLIVLITDKLLTEQESSKINFPLIVLSLLGNPGADLKSLDKLTHQLFKKPDTKHFVDKDYVQSVKITNELLQELNPESRQYWGGYKPHLPRDINPSDLQGFTGRLSDLASISEKLFKAAHRQRLLTIKGSGGLGKTTIAKKVALELAYRGHFNGGVYFIDCESVTSPAQLEMHIGAAFNLQMADDLFGHLAKHHDQQKRLLIFDNLESLLYLKNIDKSHNKQAVEQFKSLLSQALLYASVLVTSRESINSEWEDIYSFREMESEEALALFNHLTKANYISDNDQYFARRKILEPLLNNNPLAIKLICDGMPKGKSLKELKQELEDDFFEKVKESDLILIFDDKIDANVNRQDSLYASILYSYNTLNDGQKSAFESFSLFPDGIDLGTFKRIVEDSKKYDRNKDSGQLKHPVNDKDIKVLTDKSLIESNHEFYKLQSVINRFARFQFEQRTQEEDRSALYRQALQFNFKIVMYIDDLIRLNKRVIPIFLALFNNFISAISYGTKKNVVRNESELEEYIEMTFIIGGFSNSLSLSSDFITAVNKCDIDFLINDNNRDKVRLVWQLIKVYAMYYKGDFDKAFDELKSLVPKEHLMKKSGDYKKGEAINWVISTIAQDIYEMEGGALDSLLHDIKFNRYSYLRLASSQMYLAMNVESLMPLVAPDDDYFEAQNYLINGVQIEKLDKYINGLHKNEHLTRVTLTYIKSRDVNVEYDEIEKLVSVNPYTRGLKNLMYAFTYENKIMDYNYNPESIDKIISHYRAALPELKHIKYYYTQAYYFYARFLKQSGVQDYISVYRRGLSLAKKYHYRYWQHRFLLLENPDLGPFKEEDYPLPSNPDISLLIEKQAKFIRNQFGTSLNPFYQDKS